ncbi:MAG: bifunctional serine/threonine-protein kinase/formylglycine-generating enzyme family protein [Polyangiales bacterium]
MSRLAPLAAGSVVGGEFKIVRLLAEGGMGAVYVAEQLSTGAQRALKMMHRHLVEDPALRRRFEQEARVGAQIESDAVVQVLSAGIDRGTSLPYLAMELLQGEDLRARIDREGLLTPPEALNVLEQICDALGAAHRVGIVHRDLKPENVFLVRSRKEGQRPSVKVLDFGIAKLVADAQTSATTGAIGTPLWMAPEQTVTGATIGPEADVWALGLLAFTLLTGRRYWLAANARDIALPALLREVAIDPLESASARATRFDRGAYVPEGFDAWFARAIVREPEKRFPDATEAIEALAPILRDAKVLEPPPVEKREAPFAPTVDAPEPVFGEKKKIPGLQTFYRAKLPAAQASSTTGAAVAPAPEPKSSSSRTLPIVVVALVAVAGWFAWSRTRAPASATPPPPVVVVPSASVSAAPSAETGVDAKALGVAEAKKRPMVTFGGASFTLGSSSGAANEKPPTLTTVAAFMLDIRPVSASEYAACVSAGACAVPSAGEFCTYGDPARANHPMNCVHHDEAQSYCGWLGRRLPSEAEWELAATGKEGRPYPWGWAAPDSTRVCWGRCAENGGTCAVGTFPLGATPNGVLDLAGNVWEWTSSAFCPYNLYDCKDPRRTIRGGGWCGKDPQIVRSKTRDGRPASDASSNVGFRCARSL